MCEPVSESLPYYCRSGRCDLRPFPGCGALRQKGAIFYLNRKIRAVYEAAGTPPCLVGGAFFMLFILFLTKNTYPQKIMSEYIIRKGAVSAKKLSLFCMHPYTY